MTFNVALVLARRDEFILYPLSFIACLYLSKTLLLRICFLIMSVLVHILLMIYYY